MTQKNWLKVTDVWVEWMKTPCHSSQDVMQTESGGFFAEESAWIDVMESLEPMVWDEVFSYLVPAFQEGDLYKVSRAALLCGSYVERGADPDILVDAMVDICEASLIQALQLVADVEEHWDLASPDDLPKECLQTVWELNPEWLKGWNALRFIILPTMTMLARSMPARERARRKQPLLSIVDAMDEVHGLVPYLAELLFMVDGRELLVLHPKEKKGFRVRANAIRNNYHLFTLLQQSLLGEQDGPLLKGSLPYPALGPIARGEALLEQSMMDEGVWKFYHWTRLAKSVSTEMQDDTLIQGEASPDTIRTCRGTAVIVLEHAKTPYTWDANFFAPLHDALRSQVEILDILSPAQVTEWLDYCAEQTFVPDQDHPEDMETEQPPPAFDA